MKLLIEIGVEELPAIPFLNEEKNIAVKWQNILEKNSLKSEFEFYFTPRRLVIYHKDIAQKQEDFVEIKTGAPKNIAIEDGRWSKAALSFAKKCGIDESELAFKQIDGKEVLYFEKTKEGRELRELLKEMISEFLASLSFGKSMRWGDGEYSFIRPIRSLAVSLDDTLVEMKLYGVKSSLSFLPHRSYGYSPVKFNTTDEYFKLLLENGVVLEREKRKELIINGFSKIQQENGVEIEIDEDLLEEVVAITEYPTPLIGKFQEEFLRLPTEVIITSMRENQRYFPTFRNGKLSNSFVVVSNAITDDKSLIVKGNEKVLRARLSDAIFFYDLDLNSPFEAKPLKNITYLKELGSLYDKSLREKEIAIALAGFYDEELKEEFGGEYKEALSEAVMLSKADLSSAMVGEFSELQGIMGSYYAEANGKHPLIVRAIKEQYLPDGKHSFLPTALFSAIVAISTKLDSLAALFSVGRTPTGNKDPYALRRAASGIIKIVLDQGINFDLDRVFKAISYQYSGLNLEELKSFILDRLYTFYEANPSIIKAVISSKQSDIKALDSSINALMQIVSQEDFEKNFDTFKRVANILRDEEICDVDEALFSSNYERELYEKFSQLHLDSTDTKEYLDQLFSLKNEIDKFFDNVMINVNDRRVKANRVALIGSIYKAFLKIADIKEISI